MKFIETKNQDIYVLFKLIEISRKNQKKLFHKYLLFIKFQTFIFYDFGS